MRHIILALLIIAIVLPIIVLHITSGGKSIASETEIIILAVDPPLARVSHPQQGASLHFRVGLPLDEMVDTTEYHWYNHRGIRVGYTRREQLEEAFRAEWLLYAFATLPADHPLVVD